MPVVAWVSGASSRVLEKFRGSSGDGTGGTEQPPTDRRLGSSTLHSLLISSHSGGDAYFSRGFCWDWFVFAAALMESETTQLAPANAMQIALAAQLK